MPKREMEVLTPQMYYVLLVLHQPMHGYEIMNEITRITNVENNKKIYQITNLGKKKLQKEKERMLKQISLLDQIGG